MPKTVLVCSRCSKRQLFGLKGKCECGGTLLVEYDLEKTARTFRKDKLNGRASTMWRYLELLPVESENAIVTLGEGWTPLLRMGLLEKKLSIAQLWIKREEQNPTGSFKARGFSVAISLLNEQGYTDVAVPSNGNAASALAAYAGRAGMRASVFMPMDCPGLIVQECIRYGAETYQVDGFIHDANRIIEEGKPERQWFNVATLKEPGRVEGKKTMGLELAEQFNWQMPDVIIYPTGGGSGVIGLWKAFCELKEMGLVAGDLPRIVSVQEKGCQPIVDSFAGGNAVSQAKLVASSPTGLRVPQPPDEKLLVFILRATNGAAVAVENEEIQSAQAMLGVNGISASPEGAAALAGLLRLRESGSITRQDKVVLFNTAHALKYMPYSAEGLAPVVRRYADLTISLSRANG